MTNIQKIIQAAKILYLVKKQKEFSRNDLKHELNLSTHEWDMKYTGGFQGMIKDAPPLKNRIRPKYRDVFIRIRKGTYTFSEYGLKLIEEE